MALFPPASANISLLVGFLGNHLALHKGLSPCECVATQARVSIRHTFAFESWDLNHVSPCKFRQTVGYSTYPDNRYSPVSLQSSESTQPP